jgi:hypothetical protein
MAKLLSLGPEGSMEYPASLVRLQDTMILFLDRAAQP